MASESKKDQKKPFKGVTNIILNSFYQAFVNWPPDMPDDMLEDCIAVAGKALNDHDFESEGVKV